MATSNSHDLRGTPAGTSAFAGRHTDIEFRQTTFDLTVSSLGIGTYLGESTDADDQAYVKSLTRAIERGINVLDTALNYRSQRSERAVGAAIQQAIEHGYADRTNLVVCSKAGYIPLDKTPPATREEYRDYVQSRFVDTRILHPSEIVAGGHSLAPRFLKYCIAASRQNLGLRTIDVYYLHNPGQQLATVSIDELRPRVRSAFASMEDSVTRGDIGVYGVATWDELRVPADSPGRLSLEELVGLAKEVAGEGHHFRAVQLPINLAMPEALRTATQPLGNQSVPALTAASELGLTVIASASLMQSRLASGLPQALRDAFPHCTTDAQRAISFTRSLPGVTSALVGMKTVEHVDENVGAFSHG
jgi:aryl-alcohol dehydrogenase-like predicted oxidoreductase